MKNIDLEVIIRGTPKDALAQDEISDRQKSYPCQDERMIRNLPFRFGIFAQALRK